MEMQWTLPEVFQIVQTAAVLLGIPIIAFRLGRGAEALNASIKNQGVALNSSIERQGVLVHKLAEEVSELKREQKEFRVVIIQIAAQGVRLDNHGQQITGLQKELADLRRGEGFIYPLAAHLHKP